MEAFCWLTVDPSRDYQRGMEIFDASGSPILEVPRVLSASFLRGTHIKGTARVETVDAGGHLNMEFKHDMVRAQVPHLVTLIVYSSKFQLQGETREYFVYAPMDVQHSVKLAFKLWRRWEKPRRAAGVWIEDLNDDFPKVDNAAVSEPIDDNFFAEMWKATYPKKHRCAGSPYDPFAFTCLDPAVKVYRSADFQSGLRLTV
jgi:hypothetical protein